LESYDGVGWSHCAVNHDLIRDSVANAPGDNFIVGCWVYNINRAVTDSKEAIIVLELA
jgi:hypothetical protein